jgi:signal transduction histidine kinase
MKLAYKLLLPQVVLLCFIVASAAVQSYLTRSEQQELEVTTLRLQEVEATIQRLTQLYADTERDVLSIHLQPDTFLALRMREAEEESDRALATLRRGEWPTRGEGLLSDLAGAQEAMREAQRRFMASSGASGDEETRKAFVRWWFVAQRANAMLADLSVYNLKRMNRTLHEVEHTRRAFGYGVLGMSVASALIALLFTLYVHKGVVNPIAALTRATRRVGMAGEEGPLRPSGGQDEIAVLSSTLADMTERLTRTNVQLTAALSARDQFLSVAAHELKTPLTSLTLQVGILRRRLNEGAPAGRFADSQDVIERQVNRMAHLVDELLDVSRIQAGRLGLHLEDVSAAGLVRESVARLEQLIERAGNTLELELDPDLRWRVDPSRVDQLLVNLIGNAAKYAPGVPLVISLARDGAWGILRVRDAGPGIPEDLRPQLFERYVRGPGATASGLGLGLYICKQIVEAHGGSIDVRTATGQGTEFIARLPRA